jgi:CRP-like cAMP-binding protein
MKLEGFGSVQTFPAGVELFRQDEPADMIYFIRSGAVKLVWSSANGDESIVGIRWSGWLLGAAAHIARAVNPATAITLVHSTVEAIPGATFSHLLQSDYNFAQLVHESHSVEILESLRIVGELSCLSARSRLKSFLWRLISSLGENIRLGDGRLRLPLKHKEIASIIGISPEHLSRLLKGLAVEHAIDLEDRWIIVQYPEKLVPRDGFSTAPLDVS